MEHQFPVLLHPAERAAGWFAIQAPDNTLEPAIKAGDICYFDPTAAPEAGDIVAMGDGAGGVSIRHADNQGGPVLGVLDRSERYFKTPIGRR